MQPTQDQDPDTAAKYNIYHAFYYLHLLLDFKMSAEKKKDYWSSVFT